MYGSTLESRERFTIVGSMTLDSILSSHGLRSVKEMIPESKMKNGSKKLNTN